MSPDDAPDFSRVASTYGTARPTYPAELFAWLASEAPGHDTAWDAATGSGQAAVALAAHVRRVIACDVSAEQIRHARPHPRVAYRVASAEASGLPDASVDLTVVAAAIHWFDLPRFYAEARRVARPGGVIAAWTYHVGHLEPPFDEIFLPFYRDVVGPHFAAGARLVDDRYRGITLPGEPLAAPGFVMTARWTVREILAFVETWSGVHAYREATGRDPLPELAPRLAALGGGEEAVHELRWPLYLTVSKLGG